MNAKYVVLPKYLIGNNLNVVYLLLLGKLRKPLIFVFDENNTSKIVIKMHFYWNFCPLQYTMNMLAARSLLAK